MRSEVIVGMIVLALLAASAVAADTMTLRPDGDGDFTGWTQVGCTGDEYQCVDEATADTDDRLVTLVTDARHTMTFANTGLTDDTINSVTLYYYAKQRGVNNKCFKTIVRDSGTSYVVDTTCTDSTWTYYSFPMSTNPATSSAWTVSEVDALQAGMKAKGSGTPGAKIAQIYAVVDYTPAATCGNDVVEGDEVCDGTDLDGETCASQGFDGGTLSCNANCDGFVTTSCYDNTCSETDNGNDPWWPYGWTQGDFEGAAYNYTDVCLNTTHLQEYYCNGDVWTSAEIRCDDLTINPTDCVAAARSCVEQG